MKNPPKYFLTSLLTFFLGAVFVFGWYFEFTPKNRINKPEINNRLSSKSTKTKVKSKPQIEIYADENDSEEKSLISLKDFWIKDRRFSYKGYTITKKCYEDYISDDERCKLRLIKKGKIIQEFINYDETRLEYGLFNFLGKKDKQLVMYRSEGGSCSVYNYLIYDLEPSPRLIYDSRKYQKDKWYINFELIPIDIDKDGVFEFTQAIHTFDFFHASHATSVYPIAVFAYDKKSKKYKFSNRKFSKFIINELKKDSDWLNKRNVEAGSIEEKYIIRNIFLNLIYVGKKQEGWDFFEANYDFEDKKEFTNDLRKELKTCPFYKMLYQ